MSQRLAKEANTGKKSLDIEVQVPEVYHDYLDLFSKEVSNRLPKENPYDHAIDLVPPREMTEHKSV